LRALEGADEAFFGLFFAGIFAASFGDFFNSVSVESSSERLAFPLEFALLDICGVEVVIFSGEGSAFSTHWTTFILAGDALLAPLSFLPAFAEAAFGFLVAALLSEFLP
jgi:hypothetical protein